MRIRFDEKMMNAFRDLSGDENPLHLSEGYARRSQFGERVVFGVSSVFYALGIWANGRPLAFRRIKAEFKKPIFLNRDYDLEVVESGEQVTLLIKMGEVVRTKIAAFLCDTPRADTCGERADLLKIFDLEPGQIPDLQLSALAWSSYKVGMEFPGRQALYSSFDFTFDLNMPAQSVFAPCALKNEFDERFNQATLTGNGPGVTKFSIVAFRRPDPVEYPIEALSVLLGRSPSLEKKTVLITGSGRGFGAVLAKAFALQGADLVLNYRSDSKEITDLQAEIESAGCPPPFPLQGDAGSRADWEGMKVRLREKYPDLDLIVCNASPPIQHLLLSEQSSSELESFVQKSLALVTEPCFQLLPQMKRGAKVLLISSSFVRQPERGFAHYLAAKSAAEGFMKGASLEFPSLTFIVVRLPRILTDQTNLPFQTQEIRPASEVCRELLDKLQNLDSTSNFIELDLDSN